MSRDTSINRTVAEAQIVDAQADDANQMAQRYARRAQNRLERLYCWPATDVVLSSVELDRELALSLQAGGMTSFEGKSAFEVGCGTGGNLLRFLRWGFDPDQLSGCDLLPDRIESARLRLPPQIQVSAGNAVDLMSGKTFDLVFASTVFSSILDRATRRQLAEAMWRSTNPGGFAVVYDFTFSNPQNPDVRPVSVADLRESFGPSAWSVVKWVTLAPPIARRLNRLPALASTLSKLRLLNSHRLVLVRRDT